MDLQTSWDAPNATGDWLLSAGDLASDGGLRTAVINSLMSDATLHDDDELPENGDRGGWWGDLALEGEPVGDRFGSRLRLLRRLKVTEQTRRRAVLICREALAWLIADGIAESVGVVAEFQGDRLETLALAVTIQRPHVSEVSRFDILWQVEVAR